MEGKYQRLIAILNEVVDLHHISYLLEWDMQTYMPPGGAEEPSPLLATAESLFHRTYTSDEVGRLLEELKPWAEQLDPDSNEARLIKVTSREYQRRVKVPAELVAEFAQLTAVAQSGWQGARRAGRFS